MQTEQTKRQKHFHFVFMRVVEQIVRTKDVLKEKTKHISDQKIKEQICQKIEEKIVSLKEKLMVLLIDFCKKHSLMEKLGVLDQAPETICLTKSQDKPEEIVAAVCLSARAEEKNKIKEKIALTEQQNKELWKEIKEGNEINKKTLTAIEEIKEAFALLFEKQPNVSDLAELKESMQAIL